MSVPMFLIIFGAVASGLVLALSRARFHSPLGSWSLGMAGLAPAWLVSLLGFLTGLATADKSARVYLVAASAAALLGVIGTEYWVRRSRLTGVGWHVWFYWLLGTAALAPSIAVLLRGITVR